jgi:hypothetical protein
MNTSMDTTVAKVWSNNYHNYHYTNSSRGTKDVRFAKTCYCVYHDLLCDFRVGSFGELEYYVQTLPKLSLNFRTYV